jgi:putative molybdopterin biosynthesis protein
LFALPESARPVVLAETMSGLLPPTDGERVSLVRVGGRLLAQPLVGQAGGVRDFSWADGIARPEPAEPGQVRVELLGDLEGIERTVVMADCDPAASLIAAALRRRGVELIWTEQSSAAALQALAHGDAHVAGCHLLDPETGRYNAPWVERLVPFPCMLIGFAIWQQGLIVARGNPRAIRRLSDLTQTGVRFVNREVGAGARALLDLGLAEANIPSSAIEGYACLASGHLAVAEVVRAGLADAGIGVRAAAVATGLAFVPLGEERYDLVVPRHFLDLAGIATLLDALRRPALRQQIDSLGGYDISPMGVPASIR